MSQRDDDRLTDGFDPSVNAADREQRRLRRRARSGAAIAALGTPRNIQYGPTEIETLAVYSCGLECAPIAIFIHGGAWRDSPARDYAYLAEPYVAAGAHYVIPEFTNATATRGDLFPLVEQVCRALDWVAANGAQFGGDPSRIHLHGHSSGAHLAACALTRESDVTPSVRGACLASGMYDLKPVSLSKRSEYVVFSPEVLVRLSAVHHAGRLSVPTVLAYGSAESESFRHQTTLFHKTTATLGRPVELLVGEGYAHFDILDSFANPFDLLGRAALAQMGLTSGEHERSRNSNGAATRHYSGDKP